MHWIGHRGATAAAIVFVASAAHAARAQSLVAAVAKPGPGELPTPSCDTGFACTRLARAYAGGQELPQSWPAARALFEKACGLGDPEGCEVGGALFALGIGGDPDAKRAFALFAKACDAELREACAIVAASHGDVAPLVVRHFA